MSDESPGVELSALGLASTRRPLDHRSPRLVVSHDLNDRVASARRRGRKVHAGGRDWLIYELTASPTEGASLVFETELIVRRVRVYPEDWRTLDETTLLALSWTR